MSLKMAFNIIANPIQEITVTKKKNCRLKLCPMNDQQREEPERPKSNRKL